MVYVADDLGIAQRVYYEKGVNYVVLKGKDEKLKIFKIYGQAPEMGSQQTYKLKQEIIIRD